MMVRAFPKHSDSYLRDRVNHRIAVERLSDVDRHNEHWEVVEEDGTAWIQARVFDNKGEPTLACYCLKSMGEDTERYPLLDEHDYYNTEYMCIVSALYYTAKRLGTVIVSPRALIGTLLDTGVEIIEDGPMNFVVNIGDGQLVDIINEVNGMEEMTKEHDAPFYLSRTKSEVNIDG